MVKKILILVLLLGASKVWSQDSHPTCEFEVEGYTFISANIIEVYDEDSNYVFKLNLNENVNEGQLMLDIEASSIDDKEMILRVLEMIKDPEQRMKEIAKLACNYEGMHQIIYQNMSFPEE